MELNKSIIKIRVALQNAKLKKSGKNKYAGFDYFELSDFLPKLNELMLGEEMNDRFYIEGDQAVLELIKGEEVNRYTIPFIPYETPVNSKGMKSMQDIQYLGALNTYYKRYLYLNAFGITDGEVIDAMDNSENQSNGVRKASPKQVEILSKWYIGDNLTRLLNMNKINSLEDMPMELASSLIAHLKERNNEHNNK